MTIGRQPRPAQNFLTTEAQSGMSLGLFPRIGVVGEVKPHTQSGIASGVAQLRSRLRRLPEARRAQVRPQLITYRPANRMGDAYEVLAPDSLKLRTWIASGRPPAGLRWYSLGTFPFTRALDRIQVRDCPSLLGSEIEPRVRDRYALAIDILPLGFKTAAQHGADIEHELVAFLRELAAELEAELGGS